VAFVRGGTREIGHLTPLPRTRAALGVLARNVARARRELPDVPLLLENVAWTFTWPDDEMDEPTFYCEVAEETGCDLLLDLGNLYANARNGGLDPAAELARFPLERVAMVHIAGGLLDDGGFYFDTHAHDVPDDVFGLLEQLFAARGAVPVVLERDGLFPPFERLAGECERARGAARAAPSGSPWNHQPGSRGDRGDSGDRGDADQAATRALLEAQERMARLLTSADEPGADEVFPHGNNGIARSREVLRRKRVDDALPLLPRLAARRAEVEPLAYACVLASPRAERLTGVADAMRLARAAEAEPSLALAARVDALVLDARFVLDERGPGVKQRALPFVRRARLGGGLSVWAMKGPGASAPVRLIERRGG
jgi:uncharacterized protein